MQNGYRALNDHPRVVRNLVGVNHVSSYVDAQLYGPSTALVHGVRLRSVAEPRMSAPAAQTPITPMSFQKPESARAVITFRVASIAYESGSTSETHRRTSGS